MKDRLVCDMIAVIDVKDASVNAEFKSEEFLLSSLGEGPSLTSVQKDTVNHTVNYLDFDFDGGCFSLPNVE